MTPAHTDPHDPVRASGSSPAAVLRMVLRPLASLQLTVVLLALGVGLVFFGTLAQKTAGLGTVVDRYFWSWLVMIDLQPVLEFFKIFFNAPKDWNASEGAKLIPFPGGKLIGGLMFVNLIAAHALRFQMTWKRIGVWMAHGGLLLLFVGEYITREFQVEQRMTIREGEAVNYSESHHLVELAFLSPDGEGVQKVTVIPGVRLAKAAESGEVISHPNLPVDVRVESFWANSNLIDAGKAGQNPATHGLGLKDGAESRPEVSGVKSDEMNFPTAYVTFIHKRTAEKLGTYLVSLFYTYNPFHPERLPHQSVEADGVKHDVGLRHTRYYKSYSLYLRNFSFDRYTGTQQAKNYSSDLILVDPDRGQERSVRVAMNDPLRYRGETFYQSSFDGETEKATVLQVVRNPGWLLPYVACILVGVGLLLHFVMGLVRYLLKQRTGAVASSAVETVTLLAVTLALCGFAVRFGVIANWLDSRIGAVGSGSFMLGQVFGVALLCGVLPAVTLFLFVRGGRGTVVTTPVADDRTTFERLLPWGAVTLGVLMLAGAAVPRSNAGSMDLAGAARLPVVDGGRVKPLDTVARVYLRKISSREWYEGLDGKMHPAIEWLMEVLATNPDNPGSSNIGKYKVIRIENDQVLSLFGLERREGYRYSLEEIGPKIGDFRKAVAKAKPKPGEKPVSDPNVDKLFESGDRDVFAGQVLEVAEKIDAYMRLLSKDMPLTLPPGGGREWRTLSEVQGTAEREAFVEAMRARGLLPKDFRTLSPDEQKAVDGEMEDRMFQALAADPGAMPFAGLLAAYKAGNPTQFSEALSAFRAATADGVSERDRAKVRFEVFLNEFAPAYQVIMLYVIAGLLALGGWVAVSFRPALAASLQKSSFWLMVVAFVVHGFALFARMYLMDRPLVFVTNLYSTAVFIGWSAVGLGLVLERIAPIGLGNLAAAVVGGATAVIAHNLAASGDTLEMMQAVLDTNFWLATHVTTINLGYAATYVAGVIGVVYIFLGLFTPLLARSVGSGTRDTLGKLLGQLIYGVICLATLLSFVGTVLGGIWADQSWGRFWGWDPKENGAVLIVLWNALILHARWCGLVKDRGVAVLSLGGNIITTWSYFGTNQLGVGLHAYGFSNALATGCMVTWMIHAILIGIGCIPLRHWRSFGDNAPRPPAAAAILPQPVAAPQAPVATAQPIDSPATNGQHTNGTHPKPGKGKKNKKR